MADDVSSNALLRGVGAVAIGAGALALVPLLAVTVSLTKVLMFASTPRGSVPVGVAAIENCRTAEVATTQSARYEAVVWLSTTAGPDADDDWSWYGSLVGAFGSTHDDRGQAALIVEDAVRPQPGHRLRTCRSVRVLMRVDESHTGEDPITWWHDAGAGKASYTHRDDGESYSDTVFTGLRLPGLHVAVRAVRSGPGDRTTTAPRRQRQFPARGGGPIPENVIELPATG
jgi:hypothetical protein